MSEHISGIEKTLVKFKSAVDKNTALNSEEKSVVHFTPTGDIILNGVDYTKHGSYIPVTEKGANNGVATLNSVGKVPANQLPSYVDDVVDIRIIEVEGCIYDPMSGVEDIDCFYQPMHNGILLTGGYEQGNLANTFPYAKMTEFDGSKIYYPRHYATTASVPPTITGGQNVDDVSANPEYKSPLINISPNNDIFNWTGENIYTPYEAIVTVGQRSYDCIYYDTKAKEYYVYNASTNEMEAYTFYTGKIYLDVITNKSYRFSGSLLLEVIASPGTTDAIVEGSTNKFYTPARANLKANKVTNAVSGHIATLTNDGDLADSGKSLNDLPQMLEVSNITTLTAAQLNSLKTGDVVIKISGNEKHTYTVSYKNTTKGELSLTYVDHQNAEEVYYEKVDGNWTYIQTDNSEIGVVNALKEAMTWD